MKKCLVSAAVNLLLVILLSVSAGAVVNDTVKVGLNYGSDALFSANLENATGSGYSFGYYTAERLFVPLGYTSQRTVSVLRDGTAYVSGGSYADSGNGAMVGGYHVELGGSYGDFDSARGISAGYSDGFPAYVGSGFVVRVGQYGSAGEAQSAAASLGGTVVSPSATGVTVVASKTNTILFEFDCAGGRNLAIQPQEDYGEPITWFKGYRYRGGFEYVRVTGGNLQVMNLVNLEDYVQGVLPSEMGPSWPLEALKAQAVCARTYVQASTKHRSAYGFDVCATTNCQVYRGVSVEAAATNQAVRETAGQCLYYNGALVKEALYCASNGGASEDSANVWGGEVPYLKGKIDPYEAMTKIPSYQYSVTYSAAELTSILQTKGYSIGTVTDVYVSERTNMGNVAKVTFVDSSGRSVTVKNETCRTVFSSSTYNKSLRSLRFDIVGGSGGAGERPYVNNGSTALDSLKGVSVISGNGQLGSYGGESAYIITSSGTEQLAPTGGSKPAGGSAGSFTITGTGNGHQVGMSQYGAKAMSEQGMNYLDILNFYYTGVNIA